MYKWIMFILSSLYFEGSNGAKIKSVTMEGCDSHTDQFCEAHKGKNVKGLLNFQGTTVPLT